MHISQFYNFLDNSFGPLAPLSHLMVLAPGKPQPWLSPTICLLHYLHMNI